MGNHPSKSDHVADVAATIEEIRGPTVTKMKMSKSGSLTFLEEVPVNDHDDNDCHDDDDDGKKKKKRKNTCTSRNTPSQPPSPPPSSKPHWMEQVAKSIDHFFYPPHPSSQVAAQRQLSVTSANDDTFSVWSATTARSTTMSVMVANAAAGRPPQQLLWGTTQPEEHFEEMERLLLAAEGLEGAEGLWAVGLEYRVVPCSQHAPSAPNDQEEDNEEGDDQPQRRPDHGRADDTESASGSRNSSISHNDSDAPPPPVACIPQAVVAPPFSPGDDDHDHDDDENVAEAVRRRSSDDLLERWNWSDDELQQEHQHRREARRQQRLQRHLERIRQFCSRGCPECRTRLFHLESGQMVTPENRLQFVSDGPLYEQVTRLCQEYAHQLLQAVGALEWITICDCPGQEPIRALVDSASAAAAAKRGDSEGNDTTDTNTAATAQEPTLLVTTGKGKVRAGIFSRSHLLTSGVEPATALPMIQEAQRRGIHRIVLLDPNARGDRQGMDTYETSLRSLFGGPPLQPIVTNATHAPTTDQHNSSFYCHSPWIWRATRPLLYIVAYSASGAQLVRYLLGQQQQQQQQQAAPHSVSPHFPLLHHHIGAIAFTDSTHNIQWVKKHDALWNVLEQSSCLYIRTLRQHEDAQPTGQVVDTDAHWQHRFGKVRTIWAGTTDHSLCNWVAHSHIWHHFDQRCGPPLAWETGNTAETQKEQEEEEEEGHASAFRKPQVL